MLSRGDASQQDQVSLRDSRKREIDRIEFAYPDAHLMVEGSLPAVQVQANTMVDSVFWNLLSNAVRHTDNAVQEISVSAKIQDGNVVVRIADNGPGGPCRSERRNIREGREGDSTVPGRVWVSTLSGTLSLTTAVRSGSRTTTLRVPSLPSNCSWPIRQDLTESCSGAQSTGRVIDTERFWSEIFTADVLISRYLSSGHWGSPLWVCPLFCPISNLPTFRLRVENRWEAERIYG